MSGCRLRSGAILGGSKRHLPSLRSVLERASQDWKGGTPTAAGGDRTKFGVRRGYPKIVSFSPCKPEMCWEADDFRAFQF